MELLQEVYYGGIVAAFPVGTLCLFLLLFFAGLWEKPLAELGVLDVLFHLLPAVAGALALAAVGALIWPLSLPFYLYEFREIWRRLRREARRSRQAREARSWPLMVEPQPPPPPGLSFRSAGDDPPVCPVCMEPVGGEGVKVCPRCGTAHHADCWTFQGGCGRFGCGEAARPV